MHLVIEKKMESVSKHYLLHFGKCKKNNNNMSLLFDRNRNRNK